MARPILQGEMEIFSTVIDEFMQTLVGGVQKFVQQSISDLAEDVVATTPVDTGNLRGSWQPSIGDPEGSVETSGAHPGAAIAAMIDNIKLGETFTMVNGAVYAMRIEYGFVGPDSLGRVYNQAGRFWVASAIAKWPQIVSRNAEIHRWRMSQAIGAEKRFKG